MEQMQFFKDAGEKVSVHDDFIMDTDVQTLLHISTSDGVLDLGNMGFVPGTPELFEMVEDILAPSNSFSFEHPGGHEEVLQTDAQHYAPMEDFGSHFDELQVQQESSVQDCCELLAAESMQQQSSYALAAQHPNSVNSSPPEIPQTFTVLSEYAPAVIYAQGKERRGTNTPQPELTPHNLNHMLAERRRRKREKEHLDALKLLIPFPTKKDKLSILGGAIKHIQELEWTLGGRKRQHHRETARSDEAESAGSGSQKTQVTTGGSNSIRLTIQPDVLICTLSCLERLGFVVDSLRVNAERRSKVDITAHSKVEGSPSCTEVHEILKAELLKQSPHLLPPFFRCLSAKCNTIYKP